MRRHLLAVLLVSPLALLPTAAMHGQVPPQGKGAAKGAAKAPPQARPSAPRAAGLQGAEFVIVVTDRQFDAASEVDAGLVNVRLFNRSSGPQHFTILKVDRLDRVSSISEYLRSGDWNVPWINRMGGPESTPPGGVSSVSMVLEPGRYVIAQLPVNPMPGSAAILGELEELAVSRRPGAPAPVMTLPAADNVLTMYEWNFTFDGPLTAGRRTVRVENKGQFEHQVSIVRLLPGRGFDQAVRWSENPSGPPPFEGVGGTTNVARNQSVNVTVDLMPGDYALLCTTWNPLSRRLHSQHGMVKPFRVTP
jgi:hypothetical protein